MVVTDKCCNRSGFFLNLRVKAQFGALNREFFPILLLTLGPRRGASALSAPPVSLPDFMRAIR